MRDFSGVGDMTSNQDHDKMKMLPSLQLLSSYLVLLCNPSSKKVVTLCKM